MSTGLFEESASYLLELMLLVACFRSSLSVSQLGHQVEMVNG